MKFEPLALSGIVRVTLDVFRDHRGAFMETWQSQKFADSGIAGPFVQDNWSESTKNVLRGLHYQVVRPQGKLVAVVDGSIFDVAVDLRRSSPTFGHWLAEPLSSKAATALWIPPGFAHGFFVTSERAVVLYKCSDFYAPAHERTIRWNDPDLAIDWPIGAPTEPIVSAKDAAGKLLKEADAFD
jgi:dTDP-4-dehydrorhamnose 3,5-epimerase